MLINEDYFKNIEIDDDDIIQDDMDDETKPNNAEDILDNARKKYNYSIRIRLNESLIFSEYDDSAHNEQRIISQYSRFAKRLSNFLETYNVEHSDIYVVYDIPNWHDSSSKMIVRNEECFTMVNDSVILDPYLAKHKNINVIVYVNLPKFSTKAAALFVVRLCDISSKYFQALFLYKGIRQLCGLESASFYCCIHRTNYIQTRNISKQEVWDMNVGDIPYMVLYWLFSFNVADRYLNDVNEESIRRMMKNKSTRT